MAATVISSVAANAQQRVQRTAEERASMQTQQLSKKLSLSEDQQKKIQEINLTSAKNMDELRAQSEGDRAEAFKGAKKIEEDKETSYKGVLTEKQMADYMTLKAEREKKMKERMQQRKGGWDKSKKDSI
ncbi:hypothetical protein D3C80_392620 [compost metagenome]